MDFLFCDQGQHPDSFIHEHGSHALKGIQGKSISSSQFLLETLGKEFPVSSAADMGAQMELHKANAVPYAQ
ncbi:MAG: hypothetical protein V3T17_04290 [Pseudomonadales bacterium]